MAQQRQPAQVLYAEAQSYLKGMNQSFSPQSALVLFHQSASMGYAKAMKALGDMYSRGRGMSINADSALYWYSAAAEAGSGGACAEAGKLYKSGEVVPQNFHRAVDFFSGGASMGDKECRNLLAYMYFKGLGTSQNYSRAFSLYSALAGEGDVNAMYFLGLCYRNGYGTRADAASGEKWLKKAAGRHYAQAIHELNSEPKPENRSISEPEFQREAERLTAYQEKFSALSDNNYEGDYTGYVVYFDWSGKFATEISSLSLKIRKSPGGYKAEWKEKDSDAADLQLSVSGNRFSFDENSDYTRRDHYSNRKPEVWNFNGAQLQLGFLNDSIQLAGSMQFYSNDRKEPGKPVKVFLKKSIEESTASSIAGMSLMPNPAESFTKVQFTSVSNSRISLLVVDQYGKIVHREADRLLPKGTYTYTLPVDRLAGGTYAVQVLVDGKLSKSMQLVKQ
jgi:TPR repeat protein